MKFASKAWLLMKIGGIVLAIFWINPIFATWQFKDNMFMTDVGLIQTTKEAAFMLVLGGTLSLIFGVPALYALEKYFYKYKSKYIIGSIIASYILWNFLNSFPPILGIIRGAWRDPEYWVGSGMYHVGIYVGLGLTVGVIFTLMVRWVECKNK